MTRARILIAGIGNIFLGDDAFGVEVARQLSTRAVPIDGVEAIDFGIRGFDLAYTLMEGYETVILVDACPRGDVPGTLYLIEPQVSAAAGAEVDTHAMDPMKVLRLAATLGGLLPRVLLVGCEPAPLDEQSEMCTGMSPSVRSAVPRALAMIDSLVKSLLAPPTRCAGGL